MPAASQAWFAGSVAPILGVPARSGHPLSRNSYGPGLSWPLPADASCAGAARGLVRAAWAALRLPAGRVDDAVLAVSELAANAWLHALGGEPRRGLARAGGPRAELWVYRRGTGGAEVVCGVFDPSGDSWSLARLDPAGQRSASRRGAAGRNDAESGRGLAIVAALSDAAGCRRTRSRLADDPVAGKVAWFAIEVPGAAVSPPAGITPARAARTLAMLLTARGIPAVSHRHRRPARSTVSTAAGITVRCQDGTFEWPAGGTVRLRGFPDLAAVLEDIVWRHEEMRCAPRRA